MVTLFLAKPALILCIALMHLAFKAVNKADKHREFMIGLVIGIGLPILEMVLGLSPCHLRLWQETRTQKAALSAHNLSA